MPTGTGAARYGLDVALRSRQGGAVLFLYVLAALTIVGMAGMALDLGTVYLTKTRLQNALDAAALDGAKNLGIGLSVTQAKAKATATFKTNFSDTLRGTGTLTLETSNTCNCDGVKAFVNDAPVTAKFIKVSATDVPVATHMVQVFMSSSTMLVGGSAIAGPEPVSPCGGIPVAICAKNTTDTDCSDGSCFGYSTGTEFTTQDKAALGPGNWGLVQLSCDAFGNCSDNSGGGGASIRTGMAGGSSVCFKAGDSLPTKPGATTGPVDQGVNTRFNDYTGGGLSATDYPGDKVTLPQNISTTYAAYSALMAAGAFDNPNGSAGRRTAAAPVVDCSGASGGGTQNVSVLGSMCLFLTKEASGGDLSVEMIPNCTVSGGTPGTPGSNGPSKIVLYQSSSSS